MAREPIEHEAAEAAQRERGLFEPPARSTALAIPTREEMAAILGVAAVPFREWLLGLIQVEEFPETDTEDRGLSIVRAILVAETSEAAMAAMDLKSANDLIGTEPGGRSNVLEITGAIPLKSRYEEGPSVFAVFQARDLAEGVDVAFSCGARAVQAAVMKHMYEGWMPMKARLVRKLKPTERGFYPLNLESGI